MTDTTAPTNERAPAIPRRPTCLAHAQMPPRRSVLNQALVVLAVGVLVYCAGAIPYGRADAAHPRKNAPITNAGLPKPAADMRDAILQAVHTGQLIDLKTALELNEMRPDITDEPVDDAVGYFRKMSKDGSGRDILAILDQILAMKPAAVPLGPDIENNAIYVWPYLAEADLALLSPEETADLSRLMSPDEIAMLKAAKRWTWWRLAIGADGTWHSFRREK